MRSIIVILVSLLLTGCAGNPLKPSSVSFTTAEMQTALDKKFPVDKKYLGIFDLTISHPSVQPRPANKRIAVQFDTQIYTLGYNAILNSTVNLTTNLAYDTIKHSIVLKDPRLEKISFAGISSAQAEGLNQIAAILVREQLDGAAVYNFKPEQLRLLGMNITPERIEITDTGVTVHIQQ